MNSSIYPEKSAIEYFISIYLPGFIIAILFLYHINHDHILIKILPSLSENPPNELKETIGNTLVGVYTIYFITVPVIFGLITDSLRHIFSSMVFWCFDIKWLVWSFPTKEAYIESSNLKISETILLKRASRSYLLYSVYEFFGNIFFSLIFIISTLFKQNIIELNAFIIAILVVSQFEFIFSLLICLNFD